MRILPTHFTGVKRVLVCFLWFFLIREKEEGAYALILVIGDRSCSLLQMTYILSDILARLSDKATVILEK